MWSKPHVSDYEVVLYFGGIFYQRQGIRPENIKVEMGGSGVLEVEGYREIAWMHTALWRPDTGWP